MRGALLFEEIESEKEMFVREREMVYGSTAGNLTFNAELLDLDRKIGDYVIVNELLHFSVPNHGKLWKSLMRAYLGIMRGWR